MKWTDNSTIKSTLFKDLKIGEGFEMDEILYVKVSDASAFDVINDRGEFFYASAEITPRDCEIIFH